MIETLRPSGVGSETTIPFQWPAEGEHWEKVNEAVADDLGTYVRQDDVGVNRDLYALPASGVGRGIINKVTVYGRFRVRDDASLAQLSLRTHATTYDDDAIIGTGEWAWLNDTWVHATNPFTEVAWTWAEIDALEIGARLERANFTFPFCTQVYVEVDYTPVAYHLDVTINGEGLVLPEDVSGDYWEGSVIELTASPAPGWWFHSWEGTDNDSVNPTTVTMDRDRHVVCNFTQVAPAGCLPVVAAGVLLVAGIIAGIIALA